MCCMIGVFIWFQHLGKEDENFESLPGNIVGAVIMGNLAPIFLYILGMVIVAVFSNPFAILFSYLQIIK